MRKAILIAMALLPLCAASAAASEPEVRAEIARQAEALFLAGRFAELDRMAEDYRINERRTPSGVWKLNELYNGVLSSAACSCKYRDRIVAMEKQALRWVQQNPDSTTAHIVYASLERRYGWSYRGTGLGRDVAPEAWKPFSEHVENARVYLTNRKEQLSVDPEWYSLMLLIATDQGWDRSDFYRLVREGSDRHPYYLGMYFSAVRYLSPKWRGNRELLEDLANYAVLKTRERMGTGIYARIYWAASTWGYGTDLLTDSPKTWLKLRRSMSDVLAQYPDQWNVNHFARIACHAGERDVTAEMIRRIQGAPISEAWARATPTFQQCRDWAQG